MTCNRVLILLAGKILAADTPQNLQAVISDGGQIVAEIAASVEDLAPFWRSFEEIESHDLAVVEGDFIRSSITPKVGVDIRNKIFERVKERGWAMRELTRTRPSLEDIFVHMTKPVKEEEEL
jgi:ABC-type multidrug transport system ATPase subunit